MWGRDPIEIRMCLAHCGCRCPTYMWFRFVARRSGGFTTGTLPFRRLNTRARPTPSARLASEPRSAEPSASWSTTGITARGISI
jgi:hypothetical protein